MTDGTNAQMLPGLDACNNITFILQLLMSHCMLIDKEQKSSYYISKLKIYTSSNWGTVKGRVSQASIPGPLLFLKYSDADRSSLGH